MPLTEFQRALLAELAKDAPEGRYLAGGAAIHFAPNSTRYSDDLDFFHDSEAQVATAFATDRARLELLRRRGRYRPEDFSRLQLTGAFDLPKARKEWTAALGEADALVRERPPEEYGCLYYSTAEHQFVVPRRDITLAAQSVVPHLGAPGGVIPRMTDSRVEGLG